MIKEGRLKARVEIRKHFVEAKDPLMCKLRDKVTKGYIPSTTEELSGILKLVHEYAEEVGRYNECVEILEKLSEGDAMAMEKYGVLCNGVHDPSKDYMVKTGSDLACKHCGKKLAGIEIQERVGLTETMKPPAPKDTIERMMNLDG